MSDIQEKAEENESKEFKSDAVQHEAESNTEDQKEELEVTSQGDAEPEAVDPNPIKEAETTSEADTSDIIAEEPAVEEAVTAEAEGSQPEASSQPEVSPQTETVPQPEPVLESSEENNSTETGNSDAAAPEQKEDVHHEELHEDQHEEEINYSNLSKEELTNHLAEFSKSDAGFKKGKAIYAIREAYDHIFDQEKDKALAKFLEEGGETDDFQYKLDETSQKFEAYYKILKEKRYKNSKELERQKDENLKLKTELLEKLRAFVDNDENTASIKELRAIQEEWKAIGPVHPQHNKTLWANYNALLDLYYDHRSIYFELKELDKKKNLEKKLQLCVQAEALDQLENLNDAIKKLNELHEEYKHIGPVPNDKQEETWQRFKGASDKVYHKRKEYYSHLKEEFKENFTKKSALAEKIQEFTTFEGEKISDWNGKTKEILSLQKEWESIGSMPKEQAKDVNKKFWAAFKEFFHKKTSYFKTLDSKREENLELKKGLVETAKSLAESDNWNDTANKLKALQQDWKNIGPVPEKQRESIYQEFKSACDAFFNKRREHNKEVESSYDGNLAKKESICQALEALTEKEDFNPEEVYELQDEFNAVGFVPKKAIKSIQNKYQSALKKVISSAKHFKQDELDELKSLIHIHKIKSGPHGDQKLQRKEYSLKRKIQNLENDISTWKNNIGFFSNSKNATELLKDFETKIQDAENQLIQLKEELKLITYAG